MEKPDGMCSLMVDRAAKTVEIMFHSAEQAEAYRDKLIAAAMAAVPQAQDTESPDAAFNAWWDADRLTQTNPFADDTPAYWAWEGWHGAKAAPQAQGNDAWHKAVLHECMMVESCYVEADPVLTLRNLMNYYTAEGSAPQAQEPSVVAHGRTSNSVDDQKASDVSDKAPRAALPESEALQSDLFYMQDSRSYVGNDVLWWAKDGNGYTTDLRNAESYDKEMAVRMHESRITDIPWPKAYIDAKTRPAVDMQYIRRDAALAGTGIELRKPAPYRKEAIKCDACGSFMSEYQLWSGACPKCGVDNRP